jgi:hypothetical protein
MTLRPPEASRDVKATSLMVGTTADASVTETPSGNTLTMIQALLDIRELRKDVATHDVVLMRVTKTLDELNGSAAALSERMRRVPGRAFVSFVALILVAASLAIVGLAPRIQDAVSAIWVALLR